MPSSISKSAAKITALVVDDDRTNRIMHQMLLKKLGIDNQVVVNGKEAVDAHSSGQSFDLILMDMDMPVMNGIEATRKLRSMGIRSVIAGVSSHSVEGEVGEFIEAGLDDYQQKPLTTAKLLSILHKLAKQATSLSFC
ncbi:two-component response regulator 24-like [Tripterygium wilfordii]|nr:two-component response regulator 24-like [Tripterygium wilfordii]